MKTRAAMLHGTGTDWELVELELDEPKAGEVLIRWVAAGLCHSDEHMRNGDLIQRFPIVGGHEGAGVIEKCGPGVSRVQEGDHVVTSFLPVCGHCRFCATGHSNICDLGATILYVSHEFGAVERFVGRLVLVRGGIAFDGDPSALPATWHDPSHAHA